MDGNLKNKVLLIEDNRGDILLTRMALAEAGLAQSLVVAEDGDQAIEALSSREAPLLIVLDLNVPGADSQALMNTLRSNPSMVDVPVVILSSSLAPHDVARADELRKGLYIRKPTDLDSFLAIGVQIREFLEAQGSGRRAASPE